MRGHNEKLIIFFFLNWVLRIIQYELQLYFDIQTFSRVVPILILPHFLVIFSLILYSKNLEIAITKNGFDEKIFLA